MLAPGFRLFAAGFAREAKEFSFREPGIIEASSLVLNRVYEFMDIGTRSYNMGLSFWYIPPVPP